MDAEEHLARELFRVAGFRRRGIADRHNGQLTGVTDGRLISVLRAARGGVRSRRACDGQRGPAPVGVQRQLRQHGAGGIVGQLRRRGDHVAFGGGLLRAEHMDIAAAGGVRRAGVAPLPVRLRDRDERLVVVELYDAVLHRDAGERKCVGLLNGFLCAMGGDAHRPRAHAGGGAERDARHGLRRYGADHGRFFAVARQHLRALIGSRRIALAKVERKVQRKRPVDRCIVSFIHKSICRNAGNRDVGPVDRHPLQGVWVVRHQAKAAEGGVVAAVDLAFQNAGNLVKLALRGGRRTGDAADDGRLLLRRRDTRHRRGLAAPDRKAAVRAGGAAAYPVIRGKIDRVDRTVLTGEQAAPLGAGGIASVIDVSVIDQHVEA